MNSFRSFSGTVTGHNHVKAGKGCQDYSDTYQDDLMSIAVIADGHGSADYPRTAVGSEYAVNVSIEAIKEFVFTVIAESLMLGQDVSISLDSYMRELESNILKRWHERVESHIQANPLTDIELQAVSSKYRERYRTGKHNPKAYGTTLIAVCCTETYWFGLQIGDGKCIRITNDGNIDEPIPWDENCQDNITTSLCDDDAINEFRYFLDSNSPGAIFIGTDGIDNSYSSMEELQAVYLSMLSTFLAMDKEQVKEELLTYLRQTTENGSGDDVSVALVINQGFPSNYYELISAVAEVKLIELQVKRITQECDEARELVEYIKKSISKTKTSLLNAEERLSKACQTFERKASDKVKAENKLASNYEKLRIVRAQIQGEPTQDLNDKWIAPVEEAYSDVSVGQASQETDISDNDTIQFSAGDVEP